MIDSGSSGRIRGYFTLSMCSVELVGLPVEVARELGRYPQVPSVLIGRLAVARDKQRLGLGRRLLAEALLRVRALSRDAGCAMVLVDALDERAAQFYMKAGFVMLAADGDESTWPRRLVLPLAWLERGQRA